MIVPDASGPSTIERLRRELAPHLRGEWMGRNDFEGFRSERVYRLLAKAPAVAELIEHEAVCLAMEPGSVAVFPGSLYHRGGANRSDRMRLGMTIQYCQPWLRQLENMMLGVPPELAARYSRRIQDLVGYDLIEGTFVGYVDGRHPHRLIEQVES